MILERQQIHLFKSGQLTLLLVPRGDEPGHEPPHRAGARIPLRSHAGPTTCTLLVIGVRDVALGEIDDEDARELGHCDVEAWMAAWAAKYGLFNEHARVWRVHVRVDPTESRRVLPAQSGKPFGRSQLLPNALPGHPTLSAGEAPDPHAVAGYTRTVGTKEQSRSQERIAEQRQLPLDERLRLVMADADRFGIGIRRAVSHLEHVIGGLEERVYEPVDRYADADTPA